ncbi:RteC domain-containing protein [Mucilaginibacter jinjuensis]|uniref:RteC domain-containing protein n=1 Tax=Mucilaginibacter jinjuensis TaxID=1176721 RepID=A0ABY7TCX1_9SPHI|nr:RteC domain-containing protein [Mucilaginibacter jinjuensis]WCT13467.1 RteC domain-containing protein [Mucilaginibacter jinjuensis]
MVEILNQLFLFWKIIGSTANDMVLKRYMDDWRNLLWQVELNGLLSPADRISSLNTLAVLSDRIYERYRKMPKPAYYILLNSIEQLLAERDVPTNFASMQIKVNIAGLRRQIEGLLLGLSLPKELSLALNEALKDIVQKINYTNQTQDILSGLVRWLQKNEVGLQSEIVLDQLISFNFNHPFVTDYIIGTYRTSMPDGEGMKEIVKKQCYLMDKERYVKYLGLYKKVGLCADFPPLFVQLISYFKLELKWLNQRMKQNRYTGHFLYEGSSPEMSNPKAKSTKKFQTRWPADKSDLVELAYALYIYMRKRGSKVTIAELANWLENTFRVSLSRYSHRFAEIKMRKLTRPSKFLDVLVTEFLIYVEEGDAYQAEMI